MTANEHAVRRAALLCVECGKCVAVCPMAEMYPEFSWDMSPRGIVQQVLREIPADQIRGVEGCVQCRSCATACPAGVDAAGLVALLRQTLPAPAVCSCCGGALPPAPAREYVRRATARTPGEDDGFMDLCPDCRRRMYARNNR